jgi:chemotaxis response regulator CheB
MHERAVDIVLDDMVPVLMGIVADVIAGQPGAKIVGRNLPLAELVDFVADRNPHVVVLGNRASLTDEKRAVQLFAPHGAERRVVTLFGADRGARLHAWRHSVTVLRDLSTEALRDAIMGIDHG